MMNRFFLSAGLVTAAVALAGSALAAPLVFKTEDYSFYNYQDGSTVTGSSTEQLREVLKRTGVEATFELGPWARSYNDALNNPNTCVYSTSLLEERKPLFKWVSPLVVNTWHLWKKADNANVTVASLEDAKKYTIGVYVGDVMESFFKSKGGFKLDSAPTDEAGFQKLAAGRIDLVPADDQQAARMEKKLGIKLEKLVQVNSLEMGLACNKSVDDATIAKLKEALDAVRAEGLQDKLIQEHMAKKTK